MPAVLQFMLMVPGVEEADYSSLKVFVYGASPISEEVLAKCVEMFKPCKFWQAYGLTETTGAVVNLPPEDHDPSGPNRHRLRSCGVAGPGVELPDRRRRRRERRCPAGEVGEIWIRSPQVMKGYWHMPEETAKAVTADGWFKSGDAGYLDEDGYLFIHDRVKDMIVSGGENVYPAEVENVLMKHDGDRRRRRDRRAAREVGRDGQGGRRRSGRRGAGRRHGRRHHRFAEAQLATFKCPTSVDWIEALPRNPTRQDPQEGPPRALLGGHDRRVG